MGSLGHWPGRLAGGVGALVVAASSVAACSGFWPWPLRSLECPPDTPQARCEAAADAALERTKPEVIGPVRGVIVQSVDCVQMGRWQFMYAELATALQCWHVEIDGERMGSAATVWQQLDGRILAKWSYWITRPPE
jgi:hypothetical protein